MLIPQVRALAIISSISIVSSRISIIFSIGMGPLLPSLFVLASFIIIDEKTCHSKSEFSFPVMPVSAAKVISGSPKIGTSSTQLSPKIGTSRFFDKIGSPLRSNSYFKIPLRFLLNSIWTFLGDFLLLPDMLLPILPRELTLRNNLFQLEVRLES